MSQNSPSTASGMDLHLSELAQQLLQHLEREETILHETALTLQHQHSALRAADLEQIQALRGHHENLVQRLEQLRRTRSELITAAGQLLEVHPARVTIRLLVSRLDRPLAELLDAARQRIQNLAEYVDSLNRQNARMAAQCLAYIRNCLNELYGSAPPARYGPSGRPVESLRGSLLQVQV